MLMPKKATTFSNLVSHRWMWGSLLLLLVLLTLTLFSRVSAAGARAKLFEEGRQDFEENCVACHGGDGTGRGPLAEHLIRPPKDLTEISARNGGDYPFWRIFEIIAGEKAVEGHETFQMPDYAKQMKSENFKPGYLPAHVRILELTHYLESIQKEGGKAAP
jgi:mono/diheme cytochrome c family protein